MIQISSRLSWCFSSQRRQSARERGVTVPGGAFATSVHHDLADLIPAVRLPAFDREPNRRLVRCGIQKSDAHRVLAGSELIGHGNSVLVDRIARQPLSDIGVER